MLLHAAATLWRQSFAYSQLTKTVRIIPFADLFKSSNSPLQVLRGSHVLPDNED